MRDYKIIVTPVILYVRDRVLATRMHGHFPKEPVLLRFRRYADLYLVAVGAEVPALRFSPISSKKLDQFSSRQANSHLTISSAF